MIDTNDAPLSMPPARFFFEIGFFAAHAEALVKNGNPPFVMSDTLVDHAWDIARDASDDPREFDRYLSRADSADHRLAEGEAIYRRFDAANRDADGSPEGLAVCAKALRIYGADLFPATREGQAHFARVLMDAVASTIDAALAARPPQGRPITEADAPSAVDEMAARLAKADGLDWAEVCGYETDAGDCDSGTCVAAWYEDHDPDCARAQYRKYARVALGIAEPARTYYTQPAEAVLGDSVICDRCNATIKTYGDACTASLGDACPGFAAIEAAVEKANAGGQA